MIEHEIYDYVNGFLKWNISKRTSNIIGHNNVLERFAFLIWETKDNLSLQEQSLGTIGERRLQRKRARL